MPAWLAQELVSPAPQMASHACRRWSPRAKRLARVAAAIVLLTVYWVLLRLRPTAVLKNARAAAPLPPYRQPDQSDTVSSPLTEVVSAVNRAAAVHPLRPGCLERALTGRMLLSWSGTEAHVVIGIAKRSATLDAHAWIEVGEDANDDRKAMFTRLLHLP